MIIHDGGCEFLSLDKPPEKRLVGLLLYEIVDLDEQPSSICLMSQLERKTEGG
jgi:hypothetical protein